MGKRGIGPTKPTLPFWLAHFLDAESKENETALTEDFFREQLKGDRAIVLLDGLDEASSQEDRKMLIGLIEAAVSTYSQARFVVTSRPAAYQGEVVLAGVLHHQGRARVDSMFGAVLDEFAATDALPARARCVGLLGAAVRDLTPVGYRAGDPRYQELLDQVLGIFDVEQSQSTPIAVAIEAADALGQAG